MSGVQASGVQLDSDGWLPVVVGKPDWMSTITLYGTEEGWEALEKKNFSLEDHRALATSLAGAVQQIHAFWLGQRRQPIRNASKVGRNEPCFCGSGKKFKQCHGSAGQLH